MAFDIRTILARSLGGRSDREGPLPVTVPEEVTDEETPGSPITAAATAAANPDTADMAQGGATNATLMIPEGMAAMPSAAVDRTSAGRDDDRVDAEQARMVAEVTVIAALCDGSDTDELDDLVESLRELPGLEDFDMDQVEALANELSPEDDDYVPRMEDRINEIADTLTDPVLRRAAYQLAVYFAGWDGSLSDDERDVLVAIAEAFEIDDAEARALREATLTEAGEEGSQHNVAADVPI